MAQFTTGAPELQTAAKQLIEGNQNLQQALSRLQSEVEGVMGQWGGEAASAFQNLMTKFHEDSTKLNQNLEQIAEAVDTNAKNYAQQEQEQHSSISNIMGTLGG